MLKLNNILALSACLFGLVSVQAYSDADILNFALNLECLEAEFYSWAAFGKGLDSTQRGGGPASVGGMKADLGEYQGIANEIAGEEIKHVEFLRAALGAAAVPCPAMDIGPAFAAAADAALAMKLTPPFSPYENYLKFLHGALLFEDVGVMAYNGAVGVLTTPAYAAAARSIMAVEAYHAGVVRSQLSGEFNTVVAPYGATVGVITDAITTTIDALLALNRMQSIGPSDGDTNVTPTDANALAYAVTPSAVLNVVYLSPTATKGGFFPKGINGLLGKTRGMLTTKCEGPVAARYAQCGGTGYTGPMCCGKYDTCSKTSDGYSQCVPTNMLPKGVVAWYGQCGGKTYTGPKKCEPASTCKALNDYYSQCTPN